MMGFGFVIWRNGMNLVARIAKNSLIMMFAEVVGKLLSLLLTVVIARYLGQAAFGQYSLVITLLLLFQVLAEFGLDFFTIREIAKDSKKTEFIIRNVLVLKVFLGLASFAFLAVTINLMNKPPVVVHAAYLAGITMLLISVANTFAAAFTAFERLELKALLLIIAKFIVVGLTFVAVVLHKDIIALMTVMLIGEGVRLVLSGYIYLRLIGPLNPKIDFASCRNFFLVSLPFAAISIIALIYFKIDIVMLSLMQGDVAVGWYSAAYGLLSGFLFLAEAYNLAVYPTLSKTAETAPDLFVLCWQRSVKYLLLMSFPIAAAVLIFADRIIMFLYTPDYSPSTTIIRVLILTLPWIFINSINMRVLYAMNRQKQATIVVAISAVLNIILNLFLIPGYSYLGAAAATLICEIVNVVIFFRMIRAQLRPKLGIGEFSARITLVGLLWGAGLFFLRPLNFFVLLPVAICSFAILVFLSKTFDAQDKYFLHRMLSGNREFDRQ